MPITTAAAPLSMSFVQSHGSVSNGKKLTTVMTNKQAHIHQRTRWNLRFSSGLAPSRGQPLIFDD